MKRRIASVSIHCKSKVKFVSLFQIIAFDELKTDYKNPIDQCASLNPLVLPEYILHFIFNFLFLVAGEWFSIALNAPLMAYHVHRYLNRPVMSGEYLIERSIVGQEAGGQKKIRELSSIPL